MEAGEGCPKCGEPLTVAKAVEIGHIFKLGYKYSESMGARVLDKDGKEVTPIMGSYGIGIERILTAAIEQKMTRTASGCRRRLRRSKWWSARPMCVSRHKWRRRRRSPRSWKSRRVDVILDDRDERPGVKFKDADLVGIPFRINVGKKVTEDLVECSNARQVKAGC